MSNYQHKQTDRTGVSVIIPTLLQSRFHLEQCLQSLQSQTYPTVAIEIIVVVNTALPSYWIRQYPQVRWLEQKRNLGFAAAVNIGISQATHNLVTLLNDDTISDPNWLAELVQTKVSTQADMVASTIYNATTQQLDSQGFTYLWRGQALPLPLVDHTPTLDNLSDYWLNNLDFLPINNHQTPAEPFGPDAAAALYTKKMLHDIGLFDENFFAYLEDVELALRARLHGYTCVLAPQAIVHHYKHATSATMSGFKSRRDFINWWRIILKHYPLPILCRFGSLIMVERLRNLNGLIKSLYKIYAF